MKELEQFNTDHSAVDQSWFQVRWFHLLGHHVGGCSLGKPVVEAEKAVQKRKPVAKDQAEQGHSGKCAAFALRELRGHTQW